MPSKQSPSRTDYVVTLEKDKREAVARRIGSRGSVEPIKGRSDLVLVRLRDSSGDARQAWKEAHEALGADALIQPVLLDPDGKPQYPTGEVSVRFRSALTDSELERFATEHGLRVLRRTESVPEQAVFEPVEKGRYLPDIVEELVASKDARLAWANTVAKYDRTE